MTGRVTTKSARARSKSWARQEGGPVLACIDMGTNSFHMIVCQANEQRDHFDLISRVKEPVPFFRRSLNAHYIDGAAERSAIRILRDMRNQARQKGATTVLAVATSAVRESKNGEEFLNRVRRELGIDARMISGREEARLIYLGVLWSMPELQGTFCVVDIGGGSTEIIVGNRTRTTFAESYKLGAARLTQKFFRKGVPSAESVKQLHHEVTGVLRPAAAKIGECGGFTQLVGTSGTIQALAKIDRLRSDKPHVETQGWKLSLANLEGIVKYLEETALVGKRPEGISSDRRQTILAGSIVLEETMRSLSADEITVCGAALREGVVISRFLETGWLTAGLDRHRDPRSESVHTLLDKYHANVVHAEQVARIAQAIFLRTRGILHDHSEDVGHLLWSAAMLHDIGTFVGRNGHHKHSYYVIRNGGLLGHSEEEVLQIALIARYHRGSFPKEAHEGLNLLPVDQRETVADMAAILRIAEALDRAHTQVVEMVEMDFLQVGKNRSDRPELVLHLSLRPGENCDPEMWALHEKKALFEERFQVKLITQVREPMMSERTGT